MIDITEEINGVHVCQDMFVRVKQSVHDWRLLHTCG